MKKEINKVLNYFSIFAYHPTLEEIHTFLKVKITKNELEKELKHLKYTPPQYSIRNIKYQKSKIKKSEKKLNSWRFRAYIRLISLFPQIKLIGLSGSISMMNAGENDDIDIFIITAKNRLFTGRFIVLVLAQLMGLRRTRGEVGEFFSLSRGAHPTVGREGKDSRVIKNDHGSPTVSKDKVCLNLFFDERDLKVPRFKQTEFVGHEVLQMKPIVVKGDIYERFLKGNRWVYELFPNGKSKSQILNLKSQINLKRFKFKILNLFRTWNLGFIIFNKVESLLKKLQLTLINRHRTTEIITPSQLWFHPDDFEKKLKTVENG